jgi:hypothetical protein
VYVDTAALTKDAAGPASRAFYAEWVSPQKDKAGRVKELNDGLAAAIQLLNSETSGQSTQLGSVAAIISMPICPSSDDIEIDQYDDDDDEDKDKDNDE